ncbi:MAG: transglycosylase domain-containing protein, partial [Patescibacteria group bacterium]
MPQRQYYRVPVKPEKNKRSRRWLKWLGIFSVLSFVALIGVFAYFANQLPNPGEFEKRIIVESTKIYDRSGRQLLYEAGKDIKRTYVQLEEISPDLQKATIAAEDDSFYSHPGIDLKGIARAILFRGEKGGGSTITQQFIKNAMLTPEKTFSRKIKEIILSLELERRYSKDKILEFYLNQVPYGSIFYGVEAASQNYFGKPASSLTLAEAAALASITRLPTYYLNNPDIREERKNWVLDRMVALNFVSQDEAEKAKKEKVAIKVSPGRISAPYFVQEVEKQLFDMYGDGYKRMGLRVITTLNYKLQKTAEETVKDWSKKLKSWYNAGNAALVSINPQNGQILAMVGGRDFKESQVNIWTPQEKKSFQSPGSSFKPIVYATAFKKGYTPDTVLWDVRTDFGGDPKYVPKNYDGKFRGPVEMEEALAQSLNIPAVKTLYLAGVDEVANTAKSMGMIESFKEYEDSGLSMAIGGKEVVPLELVSAFGVFSTEGTRHLPSYILKIEDRNDKTIFEPEVHPIKVLDSEICRQINYILSNNSLRAPMFGSRSWLYLGPWAAAKTGTAATQSGKITDAWTIGYTTTLVTGVWVGNNDNQPMYSSAANAAAPIWNNFMKEATKGQPHQGFTVPKRVKTGKAVLDGWLPLVKVKIDKISGKLATSLTPDEMVVEKTFYEPHSILYFVDRDDPRGEYPQNPEKDPMFKNWEAGVRAWAKGAGGQYVTPIDTDDVHTTENQPQISVLEAPHKD